MLAGPQVKKKTMLPIPELKSLEGNFDSGVTKVREEVHVALQPFYLYNIQYGIFSYLNKQINRWHPKLHGILAGYGNIKLRNSTAGMANEDAPVHLDIISDFWLFRPTVGSLLRGVVTKKSASHISCLVHGVFNVPCYRPADLDPEEPWAGSQIPIGATVRFTVIKTDMSQKVPFILGDLQELVEDVGIVEPKIDIVDDDNEWSDIRATTHSDVISGEQNDPDSGIDSSDKKSHRKRKRKESFDSHETSKRVRLDELEPSPNAPTSQPLEVEEEGLTRKKKKKKDKEKERPEVDEVDVGGQLVSKIEVIEHKIDVEDPDNEVPKKDKKKKKKKDKDRERLESELVESVIDIVVPKLEEEAVVSAPAVVTSEREEKKKQKKDKKRADSVQIKPDPDGPVANSSQRPKPVLSAAVIVKQEPGLTTKKISEAELQQQLIADMLALKPKKSKKTTEADNKKKNGNVTMVVDGDPSFLVPTSTPVPRVEESRDLLITNMMAKFNKKAKKLNKK